MSFLGALADQISSQFSLGENTNNTLDAVIDGQNVKYGSLGDFAQKFDQSAERKYVEQGYLRQDPYNTVPKQFEILTQQPNATVLVKKRMFSSIAENFRPDFMDKDEKLYFRCIKVLFQNKCNQIASLEKLSKIQKITSIIGQIDNYMIPLILSLTDSFSKNFADSDVVKEKDADNLFKIVDRLRRIYSYNITSPHTNWIVDNTNLLKSQYAEGTGVIEITNFSSINTNVTVDMASGGSCDFSIQDPYQVMLITEYDIERAIADASNLFYKSKTFQLGKENADVLINELQTRLNQYRSDRGSSAISFKINPDTLLGKRVVAVIDRLGITIPFTYNAMGSLLSLGFKGGQNVGVEVPEEYLKGGILAGFDGLDKQKKQFGGRSAINDSFNNSNNTHLGPDSELNLFCRLIKTIFDKLSLMANSNNAMQTANKETNYARRKLRFNFLGKLLIQPSDVVHVYMSSNSKYDSRLIGGLSNSFTGFGFLQKINKSMTDLKNAKDTVFNPNGSLNLQVEKTAFVGASFPTWLWNMVRSQFVSENEGVHVFGGIVDNTGDSWNNGSYTVSVRCKDNSDYFSRGKINFKPGVDVFNGRLFDPLTPYKSNFDTISSNAKSESPELLEENKWLLSEDNKGALGDPPIVKYKNSASFGLGITQSSIIQDKSVDPLSGLLTRTIHLPDGLVYKWKEGIGVMVQCGNYSDFNDPSRTGFPNIAKEPFAGQDVMNVLSLLITGVPYNFATYWKTIGSPNYSKDNNGNKSAAETFYESIRSTLSKNNLLWGNFIPFKNLTLDETTYNTRIQNQVSVVRQNNELNAKIKELKDLYNRVNQNNVIVRLSTTPLFQSYGRGQDSSSELVKLEADIKELEKEINKDIEASRKNDLYYYSQGGLGGSEDISFDTSDMEDSNIRSKDPSSEHNVAAKAALRRKLRRQINYLTRRMSYNVRANDDKNLFIVDDFYDKDYDILAYNQDINGHDGIKLFNNEFVEVKSKIDEVAKLLNLEIFCDTQGHVRVRPPQYNRVPSSVFYKMMYMKDSLGIQVFPQFLSDLFNTQFESLKLQIEIIEDYIRLNCCVLGYDNDIAAEEFIRTYSIDSVRGENKLFNFISTEEGAIVKIDTIVRDANPDLAQSNSSELSTFEQIKRQSTKNQDLFRTADRAQILVSLLRKDRLAKAGFSIDDTERVLSNTRAQEVIERIFDKSGQKINIKDYIIPTFDISVDVFKVVDELAIKIGERQRAVKLFYSSIKNFSEYRSLDDDSKVANNLLSPSGNYNNSYIPEVFEHMIEDESYDDLGLGSGKRYIIKRAQIKHMEFRESPPPNTYVEIHGTLSSTLSENTNLPANLGGFPEKGNPMTTAAAIDYDLWRNYGFKQCASINVPFLRDPVRQCAPFASMILSRSRKEVLTGSITIAGNEYMQPGEVIFIEDRGLLFYVHSVKHQFTFGKSFNTILELTYGHAPGEYIPTTLDIMGKMLYNNRDLCNVTVERQSSALPENPLGIIVYDPKAPIVANNTNSSGYQTPYNESNLRTINNILYSVQQFIGNNKTAGKSDKVTRVELRVYYDKNNAVDTNLKQFVEVIKYTLKGKYDNGVKASYDPSVTANVPFINEIFTDSSLQYKEIDMSDENQPRSPSQKAMNMARDLVASQNSSSGDEYLSSNDESNNGTKSNEQDNNNNANSQAQAKKKRSQLRSKLFKYIVDCWIVYEDVPITYVNQGS